MEERTIPMKIRYNENRDLVEKIRAGVLKKGGYCPCRIEKTEENYCMCQEFRDQIADPDFEGYCHCMLYYKEK
ncbi:MAG: ferredoxin-thioredoxin reductase catalytic domain-containing protein [Coriobacteriales bacterium]|nr:ferredoxin-thioredoxin reductase catalytic domain-containing protein [Coriobacteriales bacterium]